MFLVWVFIISGMDKRILIVDDEADLLEVLSMNLESEGFTVFTAGSGAEALASVRTDRPDLVLLDVMLGDTSGITIAGKLKNTPETADIPIIMLTAKDSETDMVVGLSVGADDYITKPFSTAVLVARIEAVLRRTVARPSGLREVLSAGDVKVITASRQVKAAGVDVDLTGGEYGILVALIEAGGDVVSREQLKVLLGEKASGEQERIVDVHVAALRKKLGDSRGIIKTVHGHGYRIVK